jgi:hypothetical protein
VVAAVTAAGYRRLPEDEIAAVVTDLVARRVTSPGG